MAIKDFNYQEFAQNLAAQAQDLVPQEFQDYEKQYIVNTLLNFAVLAGEALYNDNESKFTAEQAFMITQIIAEWTFHKSVDLIRSGIPQEFWDTVLQKIAFTIFEIAKQTYKQNLPQDQIVQLVEHHVKKTYIEAITELKNKGAIDDGLMEQAAKQSNIDQMIQQINEQQQDQAKQEQIQEQQIENQSNESQQLAQPKSNQDDTTLNTSSKIMKLATVALLFKKMKQDKVQAILNKFNPEDAQTVIKYMDMPDLASRVSVSTALKCLDEMKTTLPKTQDLSPHKLVMKLQKVTKDVEKKHLETILINERIKVKRLVFNALDGEYYDMPPKVANIIATHIHDSV